MLKNNKNGAGFMLRWAVNKPQKADRIIRISNL
jgi:hypothetical protein